MKILIIEDETAASENLIAMLQEIDPEIEILKDFPNLEHTWRFGLGYGDFPLTGQRKFLDILDAPKRIGVCVNESLLLTPTKSVTCIIGLGHYLSSERMKSCDMCTLGGRCTLRLNGGNCQSS